MHSCTVTSQDRGDCAHGTDTHPIGHCGVPLPSSGVAKTGDTHAYFKHPPTSRAKRGGERGWKDNGHATLKSLAQAKCGQARDAVSPLNSHIVEGDLIAPTACNRGTQSSILNIPGTPADTHPIGHCAVVMPGSFFSSSNATSSRRSSWTRTNSPNWMRATTMSRMSGSSTVD